MDLNSGLTQVLDDGTNTYIYGNGRIAQLNTSTLMTDIVPLWDYYMTDALGSVRQLTNGSGAITYASAYDPYGVVTATSGASGTPYGYTGEYTTNGLVYLRARHYDPGMGRFLTRDTWSGDSISPLSFNKWNYVEGNPINFIDPTGHTRINVNYLTDTEETYFTRTLTISNQAIDLNAPNTIADYVFAILECGAYLEQFEWWNKFTRWGAGYGPDAKSVVYYYRAATGIGTDDLRGIVVSHVAIYAYTYVDNVFITTKVSDKYGLPVYDKISPSIPETIPEEICSVDRSSHSYYYSPQIFVPETKNGYGYKITIEVYFSARRESFRENFTGKTVHEINT